MTLLVRLRVQRVNRGRLKCGIGCDVAFSALRAKRSTQSSSLYPTSTVGASLRDGNYKSFRGLPQTVLSIDSRFFVNEFRLELWPRFSARRGTDGAPPCVSSEGTLP